MVSDLGKIRISSAAVFLGLLLGFMSGAGAAERPPCRVMLVPGAFGQDGAGANLFLAPADYFAEYCAFLTGHGCQVEQASFPADATIEERGLLLKDQLARRSQRDPAPWVLLTHSQGGLDARFALRALGMKGVRGVFGIGVPNRGTPAASWVVRQRDRHSAVYWLLRWVAGYDLEALRFAGELTPEFLERHASHFADVPGVRMASARAVCRTRCHAGLRFVARWLDVGEGDGLVPAQSQAWGEDLGEYDLDHLSEVGVDEEKRAERQRLLSRLWDWLRSGS